MTRKNILEKREERESSMSRGRLTVFLITLAGIIAPNLASADSWTLGDITGSVIGYVVFVINFIFATIFAFFISIEAWFIGVVLQINSKIVSGEIVQKAFSVTLSIANLGFVIAIIVIALATILRRETYGIKQLLWKLVVAAILVNFSLVIAGVIIGLSDNLTKQFLKTGFPEISLSEYVAFGSNMASVFQPQKLLVSKEGGYTAEDVDKIADLSIPGEIGGSLGGTIAGILSIFFTLLDLTAIVIVLGVFLVTLLIRYVTLSILVILMPLAWLAWIFPKFSGNWDKWWSKFLSWVFYAPLVIFFMWIVIMTGALIKGDHGLENLGADRTLLEFHKSSDNAVIAAISDYIGDFLSPILITGLNSFVLLGLTVGGMMAARSLSITGAKEAVNMVKGAVSAASGWAAKTGTRGALGYASRKIAPTTPPPGSLGAWWQGATGGPSRMTRFRKSVSDVLGRAAESDLLKTPSKGKGFGGQMKGLGSAVWGGVKKGSGLFKGKEAKDWECQNCTIAGFDPPNIVRSTKKPTGGCSKCNADNATANWTQV